MQGRQSPVRQAWITPRADDPEAVSALGVARAADARLDGLRRIRLVEISGTQRDAAAAERLLHASTQVYNPHKERCVIRSTSPATVSTSRGIARVAVWERGGERRAAAERWWLHETDESVEVREATLWELTATTSEVANGIRAELTLLRDARHGLLCNPWSQEYRALEVDDPLPWIVTPANPPETRGAR